jgi:hypothetical protein
LKNFTTALFFIFLSGAIFALPGQTFATGKPVGKIIGVTGTIECLMEDREPVAKTHSEEVQQEIYEVWEKVKFQQAVYAKDRFRTSRNSRLKILLADNSVIALGPNSEMKVESYLYNMEDKLRQGVIRIFRGLSMYMINKSPNHKNSNFRIVTPTANVAARGTHGYTSSSEENAFVANQEGCVETSKVNSTTSGVVELCGSMGNNIPKDDPPTPAKPITIEKMQKINTLVMGLKGLMMGKGFSKEFLKASENPEEFFSENNPFPIEENLCTNDWSFFRIKNFSSSYFEQFLTNDKSAIKAFKNQVLFQWIWIMTFLTWV